MLFRPEVGYLSFNDFVVLFHFFFHFPTLYMKLVTFPRSYQSELLRVF